MNRRFSNFIVLIAILFFTGVSTYSQSPKILEIRNGISGFISKALRSDTLKIAYLGGSITEQDGWRLYSQQSLKKQFPNVTFTEINAAIGGTGSDFGIFRLKESVLKHKPDLLFVEFAVNDDGYTAQTILANMESIIRNTRIESPTTQIVLIYTFKGSFLSGLKMRKYPLSVLTMEKLAKHYKLVSINFIPEIYKRIKTGKLIVKAPEKFKSDTMVFSPDGVHPYIETGHRIYGEVFDRSIQKLVARKIRPRTTVLPEALSDRCLNHPTLIPFSHFNTEGKWENQEAFTPKIKRQLKTLGADILKNTDNCGSVSFSFQGTAVGFADLLGPGSGSVIVEIDDVVKDTIVRFDSWSSNWRLHYKIYDKLENKIHKVKFSAYSQPYDKSKFVAADKIAKNEAFGNFNWYPVTILLDGYVLK